MNLSKKLKLIKSGKMTAVENVMEFGERIKKKDKKLNAFLILNKDAIDEAREIDLRIKQGKKVGKLAGLCFGVKANICVKGLVCNCGSKVLENFVAPFNASVIEKLKAEDAIILGMLNMDEFACGGSGETSAFGPSRNPHNLDLIPGGSSSGPAVAVAADLCDFSLGSDTGGSIRNPAFHCGIVGLKPSYGVVSRYGLIDMCMSFDQIGPLTKTIEDSKLIFDIIKGQDNFDPVSKEGNTTKKKSKYTIGLVNVGKFCDKKIAALIEEKTKQLAEKNNWKIKSVELPLDIAIETYYLLVYVEFFSATRKFDGRRFGFKIEDVAGPEVIRRIFGGSEITKAEYAGKYYRHALRARQHIKQEFEKIFKDVDFLVMPTVPRTAHKIGESIDIEEMYSYDVLTCLQNIAGLPAASIPVGEIDKKKVGLQITAPWFSEDLIFRVGERIEGL